MTEPDYDELLGLLYQGPLEAQPWHSALPRLRELLNAQVASLVLRPPAEGDQGFILNALRPDEDSSQSTGDPSDWQVKAYREQFFSLDPFANLPKDTVVALADVLNEEELMASEYYRAYLSSVDLFHIVGVDTEEPGGMQARLRFSRRRDEPAFSTTDRALIERITPHLRRSIAIYATLARTTSERNIYAGAIDQLSVATIILDERARVLNTNALAQELLSEGDGLSLRQQLLHIDGRDLNRELQEAVSTIIRAQQAGEMAVVRALRIPRGNGRADLGLIVRPAPSSQWSEGQSSPCAAVFISDPDRDDSTSQQILGELFKLTPAETKLATLLARGLSLAEASNVQSISQHTARAQLKSIFAKTGVSRQAELVRLVLKSVATLA